TPASDGSEGHVTNTWWGLEALATLGRASEKATETIAWLRSCQLPDGGFTYQPDAEIAGNACAYYTWGAGRALKQLGSEPRDRAACIRYLNALRNHDGGCGDRPGWASNPMATYYMLDALEALGALGDAAASRPRPAPRPRSPLPEGLRVFTIQIEAHGQG